MPTEISRRELFLRGAVYGGSAWLALNMPLALRAAAKTTDRAVFTAGDWKTVEAITARIIPTDHDPGAVEANCVNFIDKALANEDAAAKPLYAAGRIADRRY